MKKERKKIKVLFKIGFLYHKTAFDPLIQIFEKDSKYDVWLSCKEERSKYLWIFIRSLEKQMLEKFEKEGHNVTMSENGFDVVFTGDTVTNHDELGRTIICFVNHGSGIKSIMYRNLAGDVNTKYNIFV
ncbi:CDP-glycerol glycerophosphotransferase, partial [candidate division WOR-3 bacterium]|nr:CDP-glycerol glycerophosphotransferase [candidate division WOR-3 bacterium]